MPLARRLRAAAVAAAVLFGLATQAEIAGENPLTLKDLHDLRALQASAAQTGAGAKRIEMVSMQAVEIGAQHGYAKTLRELHQRLDALSDDLDGLYDFQRLMRISEGVDGRVRQHYLPPAVSRVSASVIATDPAELRVASGLYRITEQAQLVAAAPNWRQFLIVPDEALLPFPHRAALPHTDAERKAWKRAVTRGWEAGVLQAHDEMRSRLARLGDAYNGRIRYLTLLAEGRISEPEVASVMDQILVGEAGETLTEAAITHRMITTPRFRGGGAAQPRPVRQEPQRQRLRVFPEDQRSL